MTGKVNEASEAKEIIEDLVWQFGVHEKKNQKDVIGSGGFMVLENAMRYLGWKDPQVIEKDEHGFYRIST